MQLLTEKNGNQKNWKKEYSKPFSKSLKVCYDQSQWLRCVGVFLCEWQHKQNLHWGNKMKYVDWDLVMAIEPKYSTAKKKAKKPTVSNVHFALINGDYHSLVLSLSLSLRVCGKRLFSLSCLSSLKWPNIALQWYSDILFIQISLYQNSPSCMS